jgi:hypothetical protein
LAKFHFQIVKRFGFAENSLSPTQFWLKETGKDKMLTHEATPPS